MKKAVSKKNVPARKVVWEKRQRAFVKQVIQMLSPEDSYYVVHLGEKRARDYAADEYNYCRDHANRVVLNEPDDILADISDEIEQTIFDRFLFSGRITEADYDAAMYERESPLDGLYVYSVLSGHKLNLWHNEEAAQRFVADDVEHDPAYYGLPDDVEIEFDEEPFSDRLAIHGLEMMEALGWTEKDIPEVENAVSLAVSCLNQENRKAFIDFCEKEGKSIKAENVYFFSDDSFYRFVVDESIKIEHKAKSELFRLLSTQYGKENFVRMKKSLKYVFALAVFYHLSGHSVPMGDKRIGNIRVDG